MDVCAGIHRKGDFLFVCLLKAGKVQHVRFNDGIVAMAQLAGWLQKEGCHRVVMDKRQEDWHFFLSGFKNTENTLFLYTGNRLPVKSGKPMAEALAGMLADGNPQIEKAVDRESPNMDLDLKTRNVFANYFQKELDEFADWYRSAGIDWYGLMGTATELQALALIQFCTKIWGAEMDPSTIRRLQGEGLIPWMLRPEWLQQVLEHREFVPHPEDIYTFIHRYCDSRRFLAAMDMTLIKEMGKEEAEKTLTPLPHVGNGELMDTETLDRIFEKGVLL